MKKVISFALWGDKPIYNVGAIENAKTFHHFYPNFECWFYVDENSVPSNTIHSLKEINNIKIIYKHGVSSSCKSMMWRFEPIDDQEVEIMMSRDCDSRITEREKLAVDEWLNSDKLFHIMRDHPSHFVPILGGMFGTRKIPNVSWKEKMNIFLHENNKSNQTDYSGDQNFLSSYIYPIIRDNSIIHASFNKLEPHAKPFPTPYNIEFNFVGEYVYEDGSQNITHHNMIKESLSK